MKVWKSLSSVGVLRGWRQDWRASKAGGYSDADLDSRSVTGSRKVLLRWRPSEVDHTNIYRWVQKFAPRPEAELRRSGNKRPVGTSWRMDKTYIKVNGHWKYLYRAVDKEGQTIDFLLTAHRDRKAALRFFRKALRQHGVPEKVTIDKSGANTAAWEALHEETGATIEIRQNKYLNNLIEQDHRAVKRIVRPILGFKSFHSARRTPTGIEHMHMLKKGRMITANGQELSAADQFYSLAA